MDTTRAIVILYALFWAARVNGCIRRGRQPLLRGPEYFFDVRVRSGFYDGAGKRLLRHYWMRMLMPFVVDIPLAICIFASGRLLLLNWLVLGLAALIHINHVFSVRLAERKARRFAIVDPVGPRAASLTPRRLRDYTSWPVEAALALVMALALAWGTRADTDVIALILCGQIAFLLVKRTIVVWRASVPSARATEHLAVREAKRKYYLQTCDAYRLALAVGLLARVVYHGRDSAVWLAGLIVASVAATIAIEIKRKQLRDLTLRLPPSALPEIHDHI
jgi:hypothetical protein